MASSERGRRQKQEVESYLVDVGGGQLESRIWGQEQWSGQHADPEDHSVARLWAQEAICGGWLGIRALGQTQHRLQGLQMSLEGPEQGTE